MSILDVINRAVCIGMAVSLAACGGARGPDAPARPVEAEEAGVPAPPIIVADVGFRGPDSVLHDPQADVYLVSNVGGSPFGDGDQAGFISRVRPDGSIDSLTWIDGSAEGAPLRAPKGMAIVGDTLYVADIGGIRRFDRETGAPQGAIEIPDASFLADLAVSPDQVLYASDSGLGPNFKPTETDAIYRVDPGGTVEVLVKDVALAQPRGLVAGAEAVFVVDWTEGNLRRIERDGSHNVIATLPVNQLDGLVRDARGGFLVSSWGGLAVYRVTDTGQVSAVVSDLQAPAGIGYDQKRERLLVPLAHDNKLEIHPM